MSRVLQPIVCAVSVTECIISAVVKTVAVAGCIALAAVTVVLSHCH